MEQTIHPKLATELTTDDPEEIKKLIDQYLQAMREKNKQAEKDWEEIYRLRDETRVLLEQMGKPFSIWSDTFLRSMKPYSKSNLKFA